MIPEVAGRTAPGLGNDKFLLLFLLLGVLLVLKMQKNCFVWALC